MDRRRFCRPSLELLEDRWTPAGTVTGSFANGTWTLIGDDQANHFAINPTATPGAFTVTGSGTTLTGVTNPTGVKNIVVKLLGGEDKLWVIRTAGTLGKLAGNLTYDGGSEANDFDLQDFSIGGNLTVRNGTNATGSDFFNMESSIVKGQVVISNGDGDTSTGITPFQVGDVSFIGKSLLITNGVGTDYVTASETNIGGHIVVKNGLPNTANNAGQFHLFNQGGAAGRSVVGGNVAVSFQGGSSAAHTWDYEVKGNVTFNYGNSAISLFLDGDETINEPMLIRGNLTVKNLGQSQIQIGYQHEQAGVIVGRNLTIVTGDQADSLITNRLRVNGATLIQSGGGSDTIFIDDSRFLGLRSFTSPFGFVLFTGAGNDTVKIETSQNTTGPTQFFGPVLANLGSGDDTLTTGFAGDATRRVQLFRPTFLFGGADADTFNRLNLKLAPGAFVKALFETINV